MDGAPDLRAIVCVKMSATSSDGPCVAEGHLVRDGQSLSIDPSSEVAVEWAVRQREAGALALVTAVCVGPGDAVDALRRTIAMGVDGAALVELPDVAEVDVRTTAQAIAAVSAHLEADLVVAGYESIDGSGGVVPAAVSALRRASLVSRLRNGWVHDGQVRGERDMGDGGEQVACRLPAVISFVEGDVTPRYPTLRNVLRTREAQVDLVTLKDLGIEPGIPFTVEQMASVQQASRTTRVLDAHDGVPALLDLLSNSAFGVA